MLALLSVVCVVLIGCFFYIGHKNTQSVAINHIKLGKNDTTTSPQPTLRILHISDMHLENISIYPEKLHHLLQDKPVDLIALTGDFLDRKRTIPKLIPYLEVFQALDPKLGTYAVFGNHDYVLKGRNFERLKTTLQNYGVITMQNEHVSIEKDGMDVQIIGIDDFSTGRSNPALAYENMKNGYRLVLTHDPNVVLHMTDYPFDYLLSGHFHGGQIHWPKPYHLAKMGKLARMKMVKGLHDYDGKPFYISEGLGQTGVNIRIGSQPEITFHELGLTVDGKVEEKKTSQAG